MPNLLQIGAAWLGGQLQSHAGRSVQIVQGSDTLSVIGTLAIQDYEYLSDSGFLTLVSSFDWTFTAGDLGDVQLHKGARVMEGSDIFEVMPVANRPCVERLDSSGILLTVHTKKVS